MSGKLYGRYEAAEEIGRGAMGIVYRARDSKLDRLVALKTLVIPHGALPRQSDELKRRFEREARTAGRLVHPNIVQIYDNGEDHIAMELVEGFTLERLLQDAPVSPERALAILQQIAVALDFAHDNGVIHRDVKPANVLVGRGGHVKVMDFGIARLIGAAATLTAQVVGTPRYMAPETVSGSPATAASDNFALAEIAYELLAGQMAFNGDSVANILYRLVHEDPVAPSRLNRALPRAVDGVVARGLAKNPANRFERAVDFVDALRASLESPEHAGEPTIAAQLPVPPPRLDAAALVRIAVIPPAVVLAAFLTILLVMPEARTVAREWLSPASSGAAASTGLADPSRRIDPGVPGTSAPLLPTPAPAPVPTSPALSDPAPDPVAEPATVAAPRPPADEAATPPDRATEGASSSGVAASADVAVDGMYGMRFFSRPFPGISGVQVRSVDPGSAAWEAGIRPKDIITGWRGSHVSFVQDLSSELVAAGGRPEVRYLHEDGGSYQERTTSLGGAVAASRPGVAISGVHLEHGVAVGGDRGVEVSCVVEARGYSGRNLVLRVEVEEITGDGAPVPVLDGPSRLRESRAVRPSSDVRAQPVTLFLAYDRLAGDPGEHAMRLNLSVVDESERTLATYAPLPFLVSSGG